MKRFIGVVLPLKKVMKVQPLLVTGHATEKQNLDPIKLAQDIGDTPGFEFAVQSYRLDAIRAELLGADDIFIVYPRNERDGVGLIPFARHKIVGPAVICRKYNGMYGGFSCNQETFIMVLNHFFDESYNLSGAMEHAEPIVTDSADAAAMIMEALKRGRE